MKKQNLKTIFYFFVYFYCQPFEVSGACDYVQRNKQLDI